MNNLVVVVLGIFCKSFITYEQKSVYNIIGIIVFVMATCQQINIFLLIHN